MKAWISQPSGLAAMGKIPDSVSVEVFKGDGPYPSDPATVDFWVPSFLAQGKGTAPIHDMTRLKVVQLMSAGAEAWVDVVPDSVTLCDAMGVHTESTSEWVVTAILASLRNFDVFARSQARREWNRFYSGTLAGKQVLIVGAGDIGSAIARRVEVFGATTVKVARHERDGVHPVSALPTLLPDADVVVLIVPVTRETIGMVDAGFLARMRDGALLVNAARGVIVDTEALIVETGSGRLRAALDVTDPEPLPTESPLWTIPGVLITPHVGGAVDTVIDNAHHLVGAQLRRFAAGEPLRNMVTDGY
ncbi:MAG: 2-hydroxyacid dehydrogenase [Stackebrandtia sp.]